MRIKGWIYSVCLSVQVFLSTRSIKNPSSFFSKPATFVGPLHLGGLLCHLNLFPSHHHSCPPPASQAAWVSVMAKTGRVEVKRGWRNRTGKRDQAGGTGGWRREGTKGGESEAMERVVAEEKKETRERDAGVGVFRRKPGSTKRLCCCPARPAVPQGNENLLPPMDHIPLCPQCSPLLRYPLHSLIPLHTLSISSGFTSLVETFRWITLDLWTRGCLDLFYIYRLLNGALLFPQRQVVSGWNKDRG